MTIAPNIIAAVQEEYRKARQKFPPFNSHHEGYAILKEEVDEMWDEIKRNNKAAARKEAMQVATMALAFLMETSDDD